MSNANTFFGAALLGYGFYTWFTSQQTKVQAQDDKTEKTMQKKHIGKKGRHIKTPHDVSTQGRVETPTEPDNVSSVQIAGDTKITPPKAAGVPNDMDWTETGSSLVGNLAVDAAAAPLMVANMGEFMLQATGAEDALNRDLEHNGHTDLLNSKKTVHDWSQETLVDPMHKLYTESSGLTAFGYGALEGAAEAEQAVGDFAMNIGTAIVAAPMDLLGYNTPDHHPHDNVGEDTEPVNQPYQSQFLAKLSAKTNDQLSHTFDADS